MEKQNQAGDKGKLTFYDRTGKEINIYLTAGEDGPEFYADDTTGNKYHVKTRTEDLVDELHRVFWPLDNLRQTLWDMTGGIDEEPPAAYYLLERLIDEAEDRVSEICDAIEKQTGEITVHCLEHTIRGFQKNEILAVTVERIEQPAAPIQTDQDKRAYAESLLASAKKLQESANSILADLKDKPPKKRKAA